MENIENTKLLKLDIFPRLPFGLFVQNEKISDDIVIYTDDYHPYVESCKPYLRPMSSMTDIERNELYELTHKDLQEEWIFSHNAYVVIDWMNSKMFDYRGLIPKGLALPAKKEMYMKEAKINFKYGGAQYWDVVVSDKKTKEIIYRTRENLGIEKKLTTEEKINCMRMSIGALINSKGYYF